MQKRVIKRVLELIGAVAVVYLMLEILESHTGGSGAERLARNLQLHFNQPDGTNEAELPVDQIQMLQEQVRQVQRAQALQRRQEHLAAQPNVKQNGAPERTRVSSVVRQNPQRLQSPLINIKSKQKNRNSITGMQKDTGAENDGLNMSPQVSIPELSGKKSPDLGVNTDFGKLNIPFPSLKSSGYVLPMLYFDMGPNNLYRLFRQGCVTAYEMGRTAVVPVFHRHPRMGDTAEDPFVLPIFDTNYTVDLVWKPSDTIDMGMMKKVLNIFSMKDFKKDCSGRLDAVVQCGDVDVKRMDGIKHFQRAAGLKIMKEIQVSSYEELVPDSLQSGVISPDEYKCLGVIYGKKCLPDQDRWLATFSRIAKKFWRPLLIRKFALKFISEVLRNQPYMAVHWRYESDWLDMCKQSRPKGARERNKEICRIIMGLSYDEEFRTTFIKSIKDKMEDYNLKQLYLASPPNNIEITRLLNESFPGNFFYLDDVTKFALKEEGNDFLTNNYKTSLIEQEICFRSSLFLGAALSSWTQTVLTDRLSRGIKRHDSVLDVIGNGAPGFPQLIFQFPEGNFNFGGMIKGK